jgi:type II secretory pathway component GspD/PulD (secretin)
VEGEKSWAVLTFDEKINWIGVSQSEGYKLSLYFMGYAGEQDGSTIFLDSKPGVEFFFTQISEEPPIFRSEIRCERNIPLVVMKRNRHIVVGFNDKRLLDGVLSAPEDVSSTPGRLIDVTPVVHERDVNTILRFDGSYDWVGFIRISERNAALIIHGASLGTDVKEFSIDNSTLKRIQFFTETERDYGMRVRLNFTPSNYSIVRKARQLIVQTPYKPVPEVHAAEESEKEVEGLTTGPMEVQFISEEQIGVIEEEKVVEEPRYETEMEQATDIEESMAQLDEIKEKEFPPQEEKIPPAETGEDVTVIEEFEEIIPWNDKVSFRFNNTPVKDAIRIVAMSNGLNIVISDSVMGSVTMDLKDVALRLAFDKIVYTHGCDYFVDQGVITVKPVSVTIIGGRMTRIFRLKYADAENVAKIVRQVVPNDSSVKVFHHEFLNFNGAGQNRKKARDVAVQGIRRSSVLVVTERPEKIKEVARVIEELDRPPVQIVIESKLLEAAPIESNQIGINWDKTLTAALQWQSQLPDGNFTDYSLINSNSKLQGQWQVGHLSASQYKAVLDFLQEKTDSKLKSMPRIMAMDNEESSITVGTTVPVPRITRGMGGQGDMVTFDYKEVNIQLNVTPHYAGNDQIIMYVNPVIEEITGWVEYLQHRAPITDKRTVNSIVQVKDGDTVVIGGLIKNQKVRIKSKVPLLGSLPLIGKLFQHEKYEFKQIDLMIFITPKVIRTG